MPAQADIFAFKDCLTVWLIRTYDPIWRSYFLRCFHVIPTAKVYVTGTEKGLESRRRGSELS